MAHFYRAIAAHCGASDLVIRVTTHGRYRPELLDTLGLLFSAVPLRIDGAGKSTPAIVAASRACWRPRPRIRTSASAILPA